MDPPALTLLGDLHQYFVLQHNYGIFKAKGSEQTTIQISHDHTMLSTGYVVLLDLDRQLGISYY